MDFASKNIEIVLYIKFKINNQLKLSFLIYKEYSLMVK